ncbi:hypothetical protein E4T42_02282 [Aureobasidium subglaciale]|uniref:Glycine-rich domain-containing protein 1 n=1 Tax=Aureobasidium subglaciale (strain EXF-2481) TaxID=1043005 RepID=A0A074YM79_AURSE|nr:uncharacterized protein AUEXF2481DRAFT_106927 [Aureobasidium subglaciale EXF-2481]KAI5201490.1 hypothetical protein E4T38_06018 [Aureobasidium subglaciale]KAI5220063.1 hypothetical protein E4T40_06039 [Aureobasidium subglaciale]KAI5224012.1 hypothetical protein E4T41_05879 [Aureobasidium subglaciale]KAI5254528.1 hypothetical protein E4T42_02282 [Aureobasidium subglaciale]KAI5260615.1 hypothetical protein E4T46_05773 [Aureobasidium subglaciale]
MGRLTRAFSRTGQSSKEKEALDAKVDSPEKSPSPPPPTYKEAKEDEWNAKNPPHIVNGFAELDLGSDGPDVPQPRDCEAHLKLLECFYRLKQRIARTEGLFGISINIVKDLDEVVPQAKTQVENKNNEISTLLAEKRWQVYVSRAVQRFSAWRNTIEAEAGYYTLSQATSLKGHRLARLVDPFHENTDALCFDHSNLIPIDILMVWHSYMLNPRAYLEDCAREGRMKMWHTPFPSRTVAEYIDPSTYYYEVGDAVTSEFEEQTGLHWDNLDDPNETIIKCPHCLASNTTIWTRCGEVTQKARERGSTRGNAPILGAVQDQLGASQGYADKDFALDCHQCGMQINHDSLCVGKLREDLKKLLQDDVILPGNLLGREGLPTKVGLISDSTGWAYFSFPSRLMRLGLARQILDLKSCDLKMLSVREVVEEYLSNRQAVKEAKWIGTTSKPYPDESLAIRRMMSRYWENSSPFAIDLVGAVTRQGSFIEKMHTIDWLHSPALSHTIPRLILKYTRFIGIIAKYSKMAVPTLDVDLAWHTHQLNPSQYLQYTVAKSRTFIDHDDKVVEAKLTDAFAETSKMYQRLYGEPYSECTCWYCEAVREANTSTASRLFRSNNATAADNLHDVPSDPKKSVHISTHNAVRPTGDKRYDEGVTRRLAELEKAYAKACSRADKKGKTRPKRDDYYYSDAYGYPVYMPAYAPYMGAMPYTPMVYPVYPGCMALGVGAAGNCCAGTCGAGAAAGSCGAMGGCGGAGGVAGCGGGGGGGGCGGGGGGGGGGCGGGGGGC